MMKMSVLSELAGQGCNPLGSMKNISKRPWEYSSSSHSDKNN